jgi:cytidylate kinase
MRAKGLVVAIDGPSGAGKSSAGRALAAHLGYTYIDTGAMYRALALKASRSGVSLDAEEALAALLRASSIELADGGRRVLLDHNDVHDRGALARDEPRVVAGLGPPRRAGRDGGAPTRDGEGRRVVLDGRDIGTAVFPDAEVKFFLDADPAERTRRRLGELRAAGNDVSFDAIEKEVRERDYTDHAPRRVAAGAGVGRDRARHHGARHEEVVERCWRRCARARGGLRTSPASPPRTCARGARISRCCARRG